MKRNLVTVIIMMVVVLFCACTPDKKTDIIADNVANASEQIGSLLAASESTGTPLIPSTFKDGQVQYVPVDDWVSGFFAGTLWYMYELTSEEKWAQAAQRHTEILDSIQYLTWHHDVGFMVYDSYGNGLRLKNIEPYQKVLNTTAVSLSTRYRPVAKVLQSWDADKGWQAERGWKCPVIIDNMMNLELLFEVTKQTGDSTYYNIAVNHADRTLKEHFRPDFSCYHVVDYDPETGEVRRRCTAQGYSDDSAWARGQAWAIYGYAVAYRYTGDQRYLDLTKNIYGFLFNHPNMPEDLVPYWDFNAPNIPNEPRDASSATIIASALYEMNVHTGDTKYKETADKIIESLSTPAYRAEKGTNGGFILKHSVGSIPHGSNIDVPLNYADYYLLEALIRKGKIEKNQKLF